MFCLKTLTGLSTFVFGIAFGATCWADDVDCLQYPIFYDDMGNYLFVADDYASNSTADCNTSTGEYYVWVTTADLMAATAQPPQVCGSCASFSYDTFRGRDMSWPSNNLVPSGFQLGTKYDGNNIPSGGNVADPTLGIDAISPGIIMFRPANSAAIPVRLYRAVLDYKNANVGKKQRPDDGRYRPIFIGFQVNPSGAVATPGLTYSVAHPDDIKSFSGKIDVKDATGKTHSYHIVTKTKLN